jgi:hypothetical protein
VRPLATTHRSLSAAMRRMAAGRCELALCDAPPGVIRRSRISDGNRDGNDGSHQRPEAAVDSPVLSHVVT